MQSSYIAMCKLKLENFSCVLVALSINSNWACKKNKTQNKRNINGQSNGYENDVEKCVSFARIEKQKWKQ